MNNIQALLYGIGVGLIGVGILFLFLVPLFQKPTDTRISVRSMNYLIAGSVIIWLAEKL